MTTRKQKLEFYDRIRSVMEDIGASEAHYIAGHDATPGYGIRHYRFFSAIGEVQVTLDEVRLGRVPKWEGPGTVYVQFVNPHRAAKLLGELDGFDRVTGKWNWHTSPASDPLEVALEFQRQLARVTPRPLGSDAQRRELLTFLADHIEGAGWLDGDPIESTSDLGELLLRQVPDLLRSIGRHDQVPAGK